VSLTWQRVEGRTLDQTIEHILPQTPTDPYWQSRFSESERARCLNDIGNLCLTYDNSSYKNKSFTDKKGTYTQAGAAACYARSPVYRERDLAEFAEWTPSAVDTRRKTLLDFCLESLGGSADQCLAPQSGGVRTPERGGG